MVCGNLVKLAYTKLVYFGNGLIFGQIISIVSSMIYLLRFINKRIFKPSHGYRFLHDLNGRVKFIRIYLPQGMLNILSNNLPAVVLSVYFEESAIGILWLGLRLLQIPLSVITDSVRQVFIVKLLNDKNDKKLIKKYYSILIVAIGFISFFSVLFIVFFSEHLFPVLLGDEWHELPSYVEVLVFYALASLISLPAMSLVLVFDKLIFQLIYEVFHAILIFTGVAFAIHLQDIYTFVNIASYSRFILSILFLFVVSIFIMRR